MTKKKKTFTKSIGWTVLEILLTKVNNVLGIFNQVKSRTNLIYFLGK